MNEKTLKTKIRHALSGKPSKLMLNVGCGTDYKKGWINIDNNSDNNIDNLDLNWDLRKPLPFDDGSIDYIFNEHFMEHLSVEEGRMVLKDFMRVLKKGGVLRIATPDLEEVVGLYTSKDLENHSLFKNFDFSFVKTPAELINMNFSWWGHKWLYDWEELERRLSEAGCVNAYRVDRSISKFPELNNLEIREESNLVAEVQK